MTAQPEPKVDTPLDETFDQEPMGRVSLTRIATRAARPQGEPEPGTTSGRRRLLHAMMTPRPQDTQNLEVLTIIPTYGDPARLVSLCVTLESLRRQHVAGATRVVIADNGLSPAQCVELRTYAEALGLSLHFADAHARQGGHRHAGYARNQALREVFARGADDPWFRADALLLLDDDVALLPDALPRLLRGLLSRPDVIAVRSVSEPVPTVDAQTLDQHWGKPLTPDVLGAGPALCDSHGADFASIVAFSGEVATKTNGLLLEYGKVARMHRELGALFLSYPSGSGEDMVLSLGLGQRGSIVLAHGARVLDQMPRSEVGVFKQRARFGRDHVHMLSDLVELSLHPCEVVVLDPIPEGWSERRYRVDDAAGVIVHAAELGAVTRQMQWVLRDPRSAEAFASDLDPALITDGAREVERMIDRVLLSGPPVSMRLRDDLPRFCPPDTRKARWSPLARVAQLVGNLQGLADLDQLGGPQLPQSFVLGLRQHGVPT